MTITYHTDLEQGSEEWHVARCGLITASEVKLILTPTLKIADNEKTRQHVWELAAQRISEYVEPSYIGDDMLRGWEDEIKARAKYEEVTGETVDEVGFVTNDEWGFTLGYSPDGSVRGKNGGIECKSRRQKYQVQTVVEYHRDKTVPVDYILQVQTGLLVTGWDWIDLVSYSGGLHMIPMRVYPDAKVLEAIVNAAGETEAKIKAAVEDYQEAAKKLPLTERTTEQEMF
jgi:predicted phage-related endonuclease